MTKKFLIPLVILLLTGSGALRAQTVVSVDPATVVGPIKPMNAGNNGPVEMTMDGYKALRIP